MTTQGEPCGNKTQKGLQIHGLIVCLFLGQSWLSGWQVESPHYFGLSFISGSVSPSIGKCNHINLMVVIPLELQALQIIYSRIYGFSGK